MEKPEADAITKYVQENGIGGVSLEVDTRRYYPYGNFAATVLGFTIRRIKAVPGWNLITRKPCRYAWPHRFTPDAGGVSMSLQYEQVYDPQDGNSLVLTIDETIQHYLEKNLEIAVQEHKVEERAVGIVMDVKTGAILGMATKPDFDPNDAYAIFDQAALEELEELNTVETKEQYKKAVGDAQFAQWRNKAISDPYEPGSVFKIITAAGALESGTSNANSTFYCPGYKEVAGRRIDCWISSRGEGHGQQNFVEAVKNSCNPAFIEIGQKMGVTRFSD